MRDTIQKALKQYLARYMRETRKSQKLSQAKMAEILVMDVRSYADIENGNSLCGTVTFIHFMLYVVADIGKAFEGIAVVVQNAKDHAA